MKKLARHLITFEKPEDLEAIVLAKLGQGHHVIQAACPNLTPAQISYRLHKAKSAEGLAPGIGYARQWSRGESPLARDIVRALLPNVRKETAKTLPSLFDHPTPKTVKLAEPPPPKVRDLTRRIKTVEFGELPPEVRRIGRSRVAA